MGDGEDTTAIFERHRRHLFGVAYRMLGTAQDAEDVVQEAWIRFSRVRVEDVESPRSYLVTIVTRLALDTLRSAHAAREQYVGPWLPEPLRTDEGAPAPAVTGDPQALIDADQTASFAFLWLLERLNPVERAVLVLHEAFDYSHEEIGHIIGRTTVASRQALRRARRDLEAARAAEGLASPRRAPDDRHRHLTSRFLDAARAGEMAGLLDLLAEDVVLVSDGGGRASAATRPVAGRERVARLLLGAVRKASVGSRAAPAVLNGAPAVVGYTGDDVVVAFVFEPDAAGRAAHVFVVRNPEKLARL